ncbi:MAG: hypothetical protein JSW70_09540 [Syntrophobacterales bacterium]|nr:MAG: hypothetical protein JSW70_09540 [Syntrophobacterales bacterium]
MAKGGYILTKPPSQIRLYEIFEIFDILEGLKVVYVINRGGRYESFVADHGGQRG